MAYLSVLLPGEAHLAVSFRVVDHITVGRQAGNDLVINHREVSRKHCVFRDHEGRLTVEDQGSANGTLLGGELLRPHQPALLEEGAEVQVGPVLFQVTMDPTKAADASSTIMASRGSAHHGPIRVRLLFGPDLEVMGMRDLPLGESLTIGSDPACSLRAAHSTVASHHVRVINSALGPQIEDLGTRYGSYLVKIADHAVARLQRVVRGTPHAGNLIQLGDSPYLLEIAGVPRKKRSRRSS